MSRSHQELLAAGIRRGHEYLESFKELDRNWDSYNGEQIYPEAIALAHIIMDAIGVDKFVSPTGDGAVEFEWDVNDEGENLGLVKENSGTYIVTVTYVPKD